MKKFLLIFIIVVITCVEVEEIVEKEADELEVILFDLIDSFDFQDQNTVELKSWFKDIVNKGKKIAKKIVKKGTDLNPVNNVKNTVQIVKDGVNKIKEGVNKIKRAINKVKESIHKIKEAYKKGKDLAKEIKDFINKGKETYEAIKDIINEGIDYLKEKGVWDQFVEIVKKSGKTGATSYCSMYITPSVCEPLVEIVFEVVKF